MLPQGFIHDLLNRVDIVEVVGRHVELKKAGINHKGLCPFHGEKSPSFIVSASRQTYHCFGCGAHGDAIRFLTEQGGLGFMDAVRELAQQVGLQVPEDDTSPEERAKAQALREQRDTLGEVLAKASAHYRQALKSSPRAIDYLKGRGLSGAIAARFALGYAPEGWRTLAGVFARYDDPTLFDAGLVIVQGEDEAEQKRYDRFRDRIMFPIRSVRGDIIGFGGRVLGDGEPKYLNSPETPVFHKGQELYGLFEARQGLRDKGYALVVEGYMDVLALAQWGFPNAVATLGTACTADHVAKLFRFTESVVFSFDGDAAGRRAAARALEAALPHASDQRSIRFLFLPAEHDPDSFIRELGSEAFEREVARSVPLSAQLIELASEDCDLANAEGRAKMLAQARPLVEQLPDGLLRAQLMSELSQRGGVGLEVLRSHWSRQGHSGRGRQDSRAPEPATARARARPLAGGRAPPQTATLLDRMAWLMARHSNIWLDLPAQAHELLVAQPAPYGAFFAALERIVHDGGPMAMPALMAELQREDDAELLGTLLRRVSGFHEVDADDDPPTLVDSVLRRLRQRAVDDELQWLIESGELSEAATARRNELFALRAELKASTALPLSK